MGIKGLWGVLTPYSEKKSLHEIREETLAIDLSGWICDSQNVTDYRIQPKLYLRNLFFRTVYLLLADIKPIFVLEGDAPELKRDVMAARNAIQFRGAAPRSENPTNKRPDVARKRFKGVLKECENLLKCMGVCCIKGQGEAEATCAELNAQGLVNAVVSQDSDCFAYGAHRVYRNFSVSNSAGGGALQGSVDCYDARKMFEQNGFGRNKMVALAILCGCDYGVGACGTSITTAVNFLHTVPDEDIIPRLLSWVTEPETYEEKSRWLSVPGRCDKCGHAGRTHQRNGCPVCVTSNGCRDTGHKTKVADLKRELSLRSRAVTCGGMFPEPRVMKEFLKRPPEHISLDSVKPSVPSLIQFTKLMTYKLGWTERYCVEKFLPLLTKLHLQDNVPCRTIKPLKINKKRMPRGIPSFEIIWHDINGLYDGLIPDDQIEDNEDPTIPWTTTERQDLVRKYYPDVVDEFEEATKKPVKEKKTRAKKKEGVESDKPKRKYNRKVKEVVDAEVANLSNSMSKMNISNTVKLDKPKRKYNKKVKKILDDEVANLSNSMSKINISNNVKATELNNSKANVSAKINKLKRKLKETKSKNQKTIDSFIKNKRRKSRRLQNSLKYSFGDIKCDIDDEFDQIIQLDKENKKVEPVNEGNLEFKKNLITTDLNNSKASVSVKINKLKRKLKETKSKNQKSIDSFIKNKRRSKIVQNSLKYSFSDVKCDIDDDFDQIRQVDKENKKVEPVSKENQEIDCVSNKHSLSMFDSSQDEINDSDLSNIIENIVSEAPTFKTVTLNDNLVKLVFQKKMSTPRKSGFNKSIFNEIQNNCSTPRESPRKSSRNEINESNNSMMCKNTSYFFDKLTDDVDAFERSVNNSYAYKDNDETINYSL